MAGRFGRSLYRFSSVNRPLAPGPGGTTSTQDSAQYDEGRQLRSVTRDQMERARSPQYSPRRESLHASPTYSYKKPASPPSSPPYRAPAARMVTSPPSSPPYRAPAARMVTSPPKYADDYPKFRQTLQPRSPPEVEQKPVIYKAVEKVAKSDRSHLESGKSSSHKQPNAINITGENLGAVMEIVQSPNKREGGHIIKKKDTRGTYNISNENNEASKDKAGHKGKEETSSPASTFMNSNFQSVNNSLLYNASLAHRDPGLHLAFSRKPTGDGFTSDDKKHSKY